MTDIAMFVGIIAIISLVISIIGKLVINPNAAGIALQKKFVSIGNMTGKTKQEIMSVVQKRPAIITNNPDGTQTVKWQQDWYFIELLFDSEGKVLKILSQRVQP